MISAVVLVKNQEGQLKDCLDSLKWCDEIVVIDDDSTDYSVEVAKNMGAKVYTRSLRGNFSQQRNYALEKVKNDWVLFVDADERVSPELSEEIYQQTSQFLTSVNGFLIPRVDYLWGRRLRFGETKSSKFLRLARKDKGEWVGQVHEQWKVIGNTATFKNSLSHYPHQTIREFLSEINFYSTLRAQELHSQKKSVTKLEILLYPLGKLFYNYFLRLGFLDGVPGLLVCFMMSFHSFLVRGKLWQLNQRKKDYDFGN
ncbi:MAG: glycosyltransferase family 2 protein [Patescibacteria group bacterium]